ncbi:hypothetical protein JRA71_003839, partial [Acinetobacter baumannii]
ELKNRYGIQRTLTLVISKWEKQYDYEKAAAYEASLK